MADDNQNRADDPKEPFTLDVPRVDEIQQEVAKQTEVTQETAIVLDKASKDKADAILAVNLDDFDATKQISKAIETFGADVVQKGSDKSRLLQTRVGELSKNGGEGGAVADGLEKLAFEVKELDPSFVDFDETGLLAKISNPVKHYFAKYKSADATIADIMRSLDRGAKTLKDDNVTLEIEQRDTRELTKQLAEKLEMGKTLDEYLSQKVEEYKASADADPQKVKFLEDEVIFPLRQRCLDFSQMLAVEQQGYVAMEVIRKNNLELIRSVSRAETVTITALRTAVTVSAALYHQKITLEKINKVNETTNALIASTSKMLNTQGVEIQKQAMSANIDINTLKEAFAQTLQAMDAINQYKSDALPELEKSIVEFREFADKGEAEIKRIEAGNAEAKLLSDSDR